LIKFFSRERCFVLRSERLIPKSVPSNAPTISPPDRNVTDIAAQFTANYGECCSSAAFPRRLIQPHLVIPRACGDPVRCGFSVLSLASLEYWIARWSLSSGAHSRDPLADDDGWRSFAFPQRNAPGFCIKISRLEIRGRREDRVRAAPAVSRAK
jgi:hypothetical protein